MALTVTVFESAWNTTTTPKTVNVTGALAGNKIVVLAGGDQSAPSDGVTAATTTNTAGTTDAGAGAWTEPAEDLDSTTNVDWYHVATANVTADGTVTVSVARTKAGSLGGMWGFVAILASGSSGISILGQQGTAGSGQSITGAVSEGSAVVTAFFDWNASTAPTAWTPSGQTVIESTAQTDYTIATAYWTAQAAGSRAYGSTNFSSATIKGVAVEIDPDTSSPTVPLQQWPTVNLVGGPWPRIQLAIPDSAATGDAAVTLDDTAAGADALTAAAAAPLSDTGIGTDALSIAAAAALADIGTGADALTLAVQVPLADTGIGTDTRTVTAALSLTETGAGADALTVAVTVSLSDTATGTDALTAGVPISLADTGSGADAAAVTAAVPYSDTGAGTDSAVVAAAVPLSDTGSGVDSLSLVTGNAVSLSDTGSAVDALTVTVTLALAESGQATDALAVAAVLALADSGAGADSLSVLSLVFYAGVITGGVRAGPGATGGTRAGATTNGHALQGTTDFFLDIFSDVYVGGEGTVSLGAAGAVKAGPGSTGGLKSGANVTGGSR